jgi:tight adherence protein C
MSPIAATFLFSCIVGLAIWAAYAALNGGYHGHRERFAETAMKFRPSAMAEGADAEAEGIAQSVLQWAVARMPAQKKDSPTLSKTMRMLSRAGYGRGNSMTIFRLVRMSSVAVGALSGFCGAFFWKHSLATEVVATVVGAMLAFVAPSYLLNRRGRKRQRRIGTQLSDVLDLLVVCVEAGLGLFESVKIVAQETARQQLVIGQELSIVSAEVSAGASLGQAMRAMAERTALDDLKPLAATLVQSEQLGAQIGPTLRSSSDTLRNLRRLRAEEAAQKTVIKILFPLVIFILPAMMLVILAPAVIQAVRTLTM